MKYEFIKKELDTYVLKYKDVEKEFKTTVGVASRIQKYQEKAEVKMVMDLAKEGMTVGDLKVEKIKDGKKYIDESNLELVRKKYRDEAINDGINEICKELFGYDMIGLALEVGLETEQDGVNFATELMTVLTGGELNKKTPSKDNQETN